MHLRPLEEIEVLTPSLSNELDSGDGIILCITEDIPMEYWQGRCKTIMDNLDRRARETPDLYR